MTTHRRTALAATLSLAFAALGASSAHAQEPQPVKNKYVLELERQIAGREKEPAEQVFTNIQVLRGMPAQRILRVMELAFVPNLGVECTHCHVEGDWASDEKEPKRIARGMWTLRAETQDRVRTITGRPDVSVTCYTCHKGEPKPSFAPGR